MITILSGRKHNPLLFALVLLACFVVSTEVRLQQFESWEKTPGAYFVGKRPMMTTLDAPIWLRWARECNEGTFGEKELRVYPSGTKHFKAQGIPPEYTDAGFSLSSSGTPYIKCSGVPLLSFLIAHLVKFFDHNYYLTGTLLVPFLASLFILPLGIYFFRIGIPVSGMLGGLIGTFASGYYMRSSIGRIDTDMLNLFFPVLGALLILMASLAKSERSVLLYSIGAGLSMFVFNWWYNKLGFVPVYFVILVISLFIQQIRFRTILLSSMLFLLCADSSIFLGGTDDLKDFISRYLFITESDSDVVVDNSILPSTFPNTMTTISEVDRVPISQVLQRILYNPIIAWTGLIVFFGLAVFRWKVLIPMMPMLALGLLSFQSSNRFIMYLAPIIGLGLGWLLQLGVEAIFLLIVKNFQYREEKEGAKEQSHKRTKKEGLFWTKIISFLAMDEGKNGLSSKLNEGTEALRHKEKELKEDSNALRNKGTESTDVCRWYWVRQVVLYLVMGFFFWLISGQTAISFVPGPSIHPRVYETFLEVQKRVPENSALLTWWDYGYAITDATDLATFHDGGSQNSPKTYFIARSLISTDQDELYDITQFLATQGNRGIGKNNISPEALLQAVRNPEHKPWDPIYLFFTADMTGKYGAISKLGSWDIEKGGSKPRAYQNLACNKINNQEMSCRGAKIDLKAGFINNKFALRRLIFIRNGQVLREQKFGHNQGFTLQLIVAGKNIVEVQLIDEAVFRSNYNQMFLLGRYRKDLFMEAYNAFPFSRLYRIKY